MVIYPSPIFGPVHSRRLGVSLGINLLPADGKVCTFDCIYCECGFNADHRPRLPLPTRQEVASALEARLDDMRQHGPQPDVLTFAGNGEPTLHPQFPDIIADTLRLRDLYCPRARVSVLSNGTQAGRPEIRAALMSVDNNIQKLDTVSPIYINNVDRPQGRYDVERTVEALCMFGGQVIVQTIFFGGSYRGFDCDNTGDDYVVPWLQALQRIKPRQVMIYTIDRETPATSLTKAAPDRLDAIAGRVRQMGIECSVSY